jgi:hypothetical protein
MSSTLRTAAWTTLLTVALAAAAFLGTGGAVWMQNGQSAQFTADSGSNPISHCC